MEYSPCRVTLPLLQEGRGSVPGCVLGTTVTKRGFTLCLLRKPRKGGKRGASQSRSCRGV